MKHSSKRTTLAVLRSIVDLKGDGMAALLNCSHDAIRSIESRRLRLSEEMAHRIFHETSVSLSWLLGDDPSAPAIAANGEPYTKDVFEKAQAEKPYFGKPHGFFLSTDALGFAAQLVAILRSAANREEYHLAAYKVNVALDSLRKQFGQDKDVFPHQGAGGGDVLKAAEVFERVCVEARVPEAKKTMALLNAWPKAKSKSKKKK